MQWLAPAGREREGSCGRKPSLHLLPLHATEQKVCLPLETAFHAPPFSAWRVSVPAYRRYGGHVSLLKAVGRYLLYPLCQAHPWRWPLSHPGRSFWLASILEGAFGQVAVAVPCSSSAWLAEVAVPCLAATNDCAGRCGRGLAPAVRQNGAAPPLTTERRAADLPLSPPISLFSAVRTRKRSPDARAVAAALSPSQTTSNALGELHGTAVSTPYYIASRSCDVALATIFAYPPPVPIFGATLWLRDAFGVVADGKCRLLAFSL